MQWQANWRTFKVINCKMWGSPCVCGNKADILSAAPVRPASPCNCVVSWVHWLIDSSTNVVKEWAGRRVLLLCDWWLSNNLGLKFSLSPLFFAVNWLEVLLPKQRLLSWSLVNVLLILPIQSIIILNNAIAHRGLISVVLLEYLFYHFVSAE